MDEHSATLLIATLLVAGFVGGRLARLVHLPSVTGYIVAGLVLGPVGFGVITEEIANRGLGHFTEIALMLIAFGIGEHLEIRPMRRRIRMLAWTAAGEIVTTVSAVTAGIFFVLYCTGSPTADTPGGYLRLAALLGVISIATAPASILHVSRELRARGPFTSSILQIVAIDNGVAIAGFGIAMAVLKNIHSGGDGLVSALGGALTDVGLSVLIGVSVGLLIDLAIHRLETENERLTGGLALLLLLSEGSRFLGLSPLLAGIAAGFTIVNRDRRDVRFFRSLNAFEPPIYVLFFALAGAHLNLEALIIAGWVGGAYFCLRVLGKTVGSVVGGTLGAGRSGPSVPLYYLGFGLVPQAGVALGLVFLISAETTFAADARFITPVVLAGVFLAELTGPAIVRLVITRAGERGEPTAEPVKRRPRGTSVCELNGDNVCRLVPWTWGRLDPPDAPVGTVLLGAFHEEISGGLARFATILAHHYGTLPLALFLPKEAYNGNDPALDAARREVRGLGYPLDSLQLDSDASVVPGIATAADTRKARALVLGYPLEGTDPTFRHVVEEALDNVTCTVVLIRFAGVLHTERILVPITEIGEVHGLREVLLALAGVGWHEITLLRVLPAESGAGALTEARTQIEQWSARQVLGERINVEVVATDARVEAVLEHAVVHDLIMLAATRERNPLSRLLFGSLVDDITARSDKSVLVVYRPGDVEQAPLP